MLIEEIYYSFSVNNYTILCIVKWGLEWPNDGDFFLNDIKAIKSDKVDTFGILLKTHYENQ